MTNEQSNQTIVPYFMVLNAQQFIEFTKKAFHAEVVKVDKLKGTEGVVHAEMKIGNTIIYFADTSADGNYRPEELNTDGPIPIQMFMHVENVSETYNRAIAEGATPIMEPSEESGYMGGFVDPFKNLWWVQ